MRLRAPSPLLAATALAVVGAALAVPVLGCALPACTGEIEVAGDHGCCEPPVQLSGPSCCGEEVSAAEGRPGRLPALERAPSPAAIPAAGVPLAGPGPAATPSRPGLDASSRGAPPEALYTLFSCLLI